MSTCHQCSFYSFDLLWVFGMLQHPLNDLAFRNHTPHTANQTLLLGQSGDKSDPSISNITFLVQTLLKLILKLVVKDLWVGAKESRNGFGGSFSD